MDKALDVGLSYTDLELVTSEFERKPKFRMSRSFKSLRKIDFCVQLFTEGRYNSLFPAYIVGDDAS